MGKGRGGVVFWVRQYEAGGYHGQGPQQDPQCEPEKEVFALVGGNRGRAYPGGDPGKKVYHLCVFSIVVIRQTASNSLDA